MSLKPLQVRNRENLSVKAIKAVAVFEKLLGELSKRAMPESTETFVNELIERINATVLPENQLLKPIAKSQAQILQQVKKELKWVPKNHYRVLFTLFGMSAFGIPIGVAIGTLANNMGLLGLGFPFGMSIGFAIGHVKDEKAAAENRQLDLNV